MAKVSLLAVILVLALLTAGLYVLFQSSTTDPLAEFRTEDGKLTIPGGQFTKELQNRLFPPKPPETYTTYAPDRSPYPTLAIVGTEHTYPSAVVSQEANLDIDVFGSLRSVFGQVFAFFFGSAVAADRFAVFDDALCAGTPNPTNLATDADCWSATSGGVGGVGVPTSTDTALLDVNSGAGTGTFDAAMDVLGWDATGFLGTVNTASFALDIGTGTFTNGGTFQAMASTITMHGDWDSGAGTFTYGTSTTIFATTGTVTTSGVVSTRYFYNFTINASIITTFTTSIGVANVLTVNGTLASSGGDAQRVFMVFGDAAAGTPVVIGVGGDLSQSGYFTYRVVGTYDVVGTTYQHLAVQGSSGGIANLAGNVSTPLCGTYVDCAIILNGFQPSTVFTVNTNNYSMTVGGTLWLGDGGNFGVTFNAGSSAVSAYGIAPLGNFVIVNWQTATVTARPSSTVTNQCHYTTGTVEINFGTSTFNCYGQFRLSSGFIDAGSANINIIHDIGCIPSPECGTDIPGVSSPGEVVIYGGAYIIFGNSTWSMDSLWQNGNLSAQPNWDAGTATMTFHQTGINTEYNFGGAPLGEAEFFNVIFDFDGTVGDTTITFVVDSLWVANAMTARDTSGGTTTISTLGLNIDTGSLTVGNGGILTLNDSTFTVTGTYDDTAGTVNAGTSEVVFNGADQSISLRDANVYYDMTFSGTGTKTIAVMSSVGIQSVLTIATGVTISGAAARRFRLQGVPASISATGTIGVNIEIEYDQAAPTTVVGRDYQALIIDPSADVTMTLGGAITATALMVSNGILNTSAVSNFAITATSLTLNGGNVVSNGSMIDFSGAVTISVVASYIDFGSSTWQVGGDWTNASTSLSWDSGTSTITFDGAGTQTIGGTGTNNIFNDVVVSGGEKDFTADFTTSDFTSSGSVRVEVTEAVPTWTIRVGSEIRGQGGILTLRSSTDGNLWLLASQDIALGVAAFSVDVMDSDANGGGAISALDASNINSGNNFNWTFAEVAGGPIGGEGVLSGAVRFAVEYPDAGPFDWLFLEENACLEVEFRDSREAALYIWIFGDGKILTTTDTTVSYRYSEQDIYPVRVVVFESIGEGLGSTKFYALEVNTIDGQCSLPSFAWLIILPVAIVTAGAGIVALVLSGLTAKSVVAKKLRNRLLIVFAVGLIVLLVLLNFAGWRP